MNFLLIIIHDKIPMIMCQITRIAITRVVFVNPGLKFKGRNA